jgi:SAM-dependent methyltransferase
MRGLKERYLDPRRPLVVGDIGSHDEGFNYRALFANPGWAYVGVDLFAGTNVDVVMPSPYEFPFPDEHFDVLISGQTFEHVKFFWLTWMEMVRTLKPGGYIFLIAPSRGHEHRCPVDCWRFYPDGYRALAEYGRIDCLEAHTDWAAYPWARGRMWGDTVGAFAKPPYGLTERAAAWLRGPGAAPMVPGAAARALSRATVTVRETAREILRRLSGLKASR